MTNTLNQGAFGRLVGTFTATGASDVTVAATKITSESLVVFYA